MKNIITLVCIAFLALTAKPLSGQIMQKTVGIRTGDYYGISGSLKYTDHMALEGILGIRNGGGILSLRISKYMPLDYYWSEGFNWYYSIGTHFGTARIRDYDDLDYFEPFEDYERHTAFVAGINGAIGLEYEFERLPFYLGLEVTPVIELHNVSHLYIGLFGTSFTIKYKLDHYYNRK